MRSVDNCCVTLLRQCSSAVETKTLLREWYLQLKVLPGDTVTEGKC
jgi:hypothetical protein